MKKILIACIAVPVISLFSLLCFPWVHKNIKKILIVCMIVPTVFLLCYLYFPWVILPVNSIRHNLTLVQYCGPYMKRITLSHYIDDVHVNDYVLDLKIGLQHQKPQSYKLPQLDEGKAEITIELEDGNDRHYINLKINFEDVHELYEKGLLVYLTNDSKSYITIGDLVWADQYVYFISGKDKICYFEKGGSSEWSLINDTFPPRFTKQYNSYIPGYYGWKENKWVLVPANTE